MCLPLLDGCPTVPGAVISNGGSLWVSPLVPVKEKRKHCKRGWAQLGQHVTGVQTQLRNTMLPRLSVGTGSVSENCQVMAKKPPSASAAVPASPALNNPCKQKSALPAQPQNWGCLSDGAGGECFRNKGSNLYILGKFKDTQRMKSQILLS